MKLYSYEKIWKVEKKIYSFQNLHFPAPIRPAELLYFAGCLLVMIALSALLPFLKIVPVLIRLVAIPFFATKFLMKKKLDGKAPHHFFADYLKYLSGRRSRKQFFRPAAVQAETIRLNWSCGTRTT